MADVYVAETDVDLTVEAKSKLDEFTDALEFIDDVKTITVIIDYSLLFGGYSVWIEFDEKFIVVGLDKLINLLGNVSALDVATFIYEECLNTYEE